MTLMQLIKTVLDDLYKRIHVQDEATKDQLIRAELETIKREYSQLTNVAAKPIDYSDPIKRFAYIYKYTVAHADYIMQLVRDNAELNAVFSKKEIDIACLGGGPGSDLLGILKYILARKCDAILTCYIFDKERAWGDSWSRVAKRMNTPCQVHPNFNQMDVTISQTWSAYEDYLNSDIITISYFLSEVWRLKTKAEPFFQHTFSKARPGALFLYIDNSSSHFCSWFDYMAAHDGLQVIASGSREFVFSNDEEKKDLSPYLEKFDWPKRKSDAAFRIMQKT